MQDYIRCAQFIIHKLFRYCSESALGVTHLLAAVSTAAPAVSTAAAAVAVVAPRPPAPRVRALRPAEDAHESVVRLLHLVEPRRSRLALGIGRIRG